MLGIYSAQELHSNLSDIVDYCRVNPKPAYIHVDEQGGLAVMAIEAYEQMEERCELVEKKIELYRLLMKRHLEVLEGKVKPLDVAMREINQEVFGD